MLKGNLGRAIPKIKHNCGRVWYGCFTPSEVIELVDNGALVEGHTNRYALEYIKICKKIGKCQTHWFYFTPTGRLKELIKEHFNETL